MATLERRIPLLTPKQTLLTDAVVSGVVGLTSLLGGRWLDSFLGLPTSLLAGSGAIAIAYAFGLMMMARSAPVSVAGVRVVIAGNLVWATTCAILLLDGWIEPTALGVGFALLHIAGAVVLADLQAMALRAER